MIKIISIIFAIFLVILAYQTRISIENFHWYLSVIIVYILIIFIIISYRFYFIALPFFQKEYKKADEGLKNTLVSAKNSKIFYAYRKDNLLIANLLFYNHKSLEPYYPFSYYELLFYGIYVRASGDFAYEFKIISDKKLLFLYEKNAYFMRATTSDNIEFNKKFKLYLSKPQDFAFFSPQKLERICKASRYINAKMSLIFKPSFCELYIHNFQFSKNIEKEIFSIKALLKEFYA